MGAIRPRETRPARARPRGHNCKPWTERQVEVVVTLRLEGRTVDQVRQVLASKLKCFRSAQAIADRFNMVATDEQKALMVELNRINQARGRASNAAERVARAAEANRRRHAAEKAARALEEKAKSRPRIRYLTSWTAPRD